MAEPYKRVACGDLASSPAKKLKNTMTSAGLSILGPGFIQLPQNSSQFLNLSPLTTEQLHKTACSLKTANQNNLPETSQTARLDWSATIATENQLQVRTRNESNATLVTRSMEIIPVDSYCQLSAGKVYAADNCYYALTLSQSNIAKDDNKFYIVQLIVSEADASTSVYYVFSRWGRVGVDGQKNQAGPFTLKEALKVYTAKVQDKTRVGAFRVVEVKHQQPEKAIDIGEYFSSSTDRLSPLPESVHDLVRLIFDFQMMNSQMKEIGYDNKRSPLGLLAKSNIDRGYQALEKILLALKAASASEKKKTLNEASGEFYSAIPHDFGYLNIQAFVLDTEDKVKQKLELLASLAQIQECSRLMNDNTEDCNLSDVDRKYKKLNVQLEPLGKGTYAYEVLMKYVQNTHGKTHNKYTLQVLDIFAVRKTDQEQHFRHELGNSMLLWHGSRLTNYVGILSDGLKIAPYEAPVTGYMFGKGIYFADMVSKSANYCHPTKNNNIGLMLLCEVALGEMNDRFSADYHAHNLPKDKHSTRGVGQFAPQSGQFLDHVWVPNDSVEATKRQVLDD